MLALSLFLPTIMLAQTSGNPEYPENSPEYLESTGKSSLEVNQTAIAGSRGNFSPKDIPQEGILLVPNSGDNTIMALNPETGELIDVEFFPPDDENLSTPIEILFNGQTFFISDQLKKLIQEYDQEGNFLGTFAPIGGENQDILHNIRGIHLRENGNLLVTVAGGANSNSVAEFDSDGEYLGNFIANGAGGLNGPWDILYRPDFDDYLVSANGSSGIHRYDSEGEFIDMFVSGLSFPEQMQLLENGNILVANFSGSPGLYEYDSEGNQVGFYNIVTGLRGVHELPDGNILVTNNSGVYKINRQNQNLGQMVAGNARFISLVLPFDGLQVSLGDDFNIMTGNDAQLGDNLEVIGGEAPYSYAWTLDDSEWTSDLENPTYSFTEEGLHVFRLVVSDSEELTGSAKLEVFVYPELIADAGDDLFVKVNNTITLGAEVVSDGGMEPHSYLWSLQDSDWTSQESRPAVSFENKGDYIFTLTVTDTENNTAEDNMLLTVYEQLQANAGANQTVEANEEFTLGGDPSAVDGVGPYTYLWLLGGGEWTSDQANPLLSLPNPGNYLFTLRVTDALQTTAFDQVTITVTEPTFVNETELNHIKVFPNPASSYVRIELPTGFSDEIIVYNLNGSEIFRSKQTGRFFELKTENWPVGTYIIKAGKLEQKFLLIR